MIIIGCDYHPGFQQIAWIDTESGELNERRLAHREEAERFYRDLGAQGVSVRVGMEASGHARWFEGLLGELHFELRIGDAAEIRAKRVRKQKTDRQDAQLLLTLLIEDRFPSIWVPSWENRDLRQLLWHRHRMVQMRTRIVNQLRILAIRLLFAYSLGSNFGRVPNPQLEVQLRQQPFKPARMPTGFHPHAHLHSLRREIAVEHLRFLAVLQSLLLQFSSVGIHKRNLLEGWVVIASYNHHVRLLSPEPFGWFAPPKSTRASEPTLLWNQLHNYPARAGAECDPLVNE